MTSSRAQFQPSAAIHVSDIRHRTTTDAHWWRASTGGQILFLTTRLVPPGCAPTISIAIHTSECLRLEGAQVESPAANSAVGHLRPNFRAHNSKAPETDRPSRVADADCSSCIRSNIDFKVRQGLGANCPQCRAVCLEQDLRPNLALREATAAYETARQQLLTAIVSCSRAKSPPHDSASPPRVPGRATIKSALKAAAPSNGIGNGSTPAIQEAPKLLVRRTRRREAETVNLVSSDGGSDAADDAVDADYEVRQREPVYRSCQAAFDIGLLEHPFPMFLLLACTMPVASSVKQ